MFAPNCVGTANATTAGWGNLGGGVTQMVMPLLFAAIVSLGATDSDGVPLGDVRAGRRCCCVMGVVYYFFTQDTPRRQLRANCALAGKQVACGQGSGRSRGSARPARVGAVRGVRPRASVSS